MTLVAARPLRAAAANPWSTAALLVAGLFAAVLLRAALTRLGADPLLLGAAFGITLVVVWVAGRRAPERGGPASDAPPTPGSALARLRTTHAPALIEGLLFGLALVGIALAGSWLGGLHLVPGSSRPAAPFAAWALVTLVVAAAEEGILRGVLFDRLRAAGGPSIAVIVTTVAFALMHVPLYGWGVVPLDLAVGLALGGLRLRTGTLLAPVVAHGVANLATWWL